jgi:C_GCAxxG_C_C family probable redox protein
MLGTVFIMTPDMVWWFIIEQTANVQRMAMTDRITGVEGFLAGNGCSQAVLTHFCEQLGLDKTTALKISSGFPAGMQMAGVCGAVSGAYMVLGLRFADKDSGSSAGRRQVYEKVAEFNHQFRERNATANCKELLGCDIMSPAGKELAVQKNLFRTVCPKFVEDAVQILQTIIETSENEASSKDKEVLS